MCKSNQLVSQGFQGQFKGNNSEISSSAELSVESNNLFGTIFLNGKKGTINGTIEGNVCNGTIYDKEVSKTYSFTSSITNNDLHISIVFPELNNQIIDLVMQREETNSILKTETKLINDAFSKNPNLVGIWRHTEILSSNSSGFYASFSTDYFMEFKSDGTVLSWVGKSAGSGYSVNSQDYSNADKGEWYTDGKTLYFVDPVTTQKASTLFIVEPERLMLHNDGSDKKIFERVY